MTRKLKAYSARLYGLTVELREALGPSKRGSDQEAQLIVTAHSLEEARHLFGMSASDMAWSGRIAHDEATSDAAFALPPGQVAARWAGWNRHDDDVWVQCGPVHPRGVVPGARSDLALAAELVAQSKAAKEARKTKAEQDEIRRREQRSRRAESTRRAEEAVDRLRPVLVEEGIHPDTLHVESAGVWLAPEVAETIAGWLAEWQDLRNL